MREVRAGERDRQSVLAGQLERARTLFLLGDMTEAAYRAKSAEIKGQMGTMTMPSIPSLEAVAKVIGDLGSAWADGPSELQAAIPPLILRSAEVRDGRVDAWVVDAALRPLLEACANSDGSGYTVRYSA